jgi:hypothetical protein
VELDQDRQADMVKNRHQPGVGLTNSQRSASSIEPQVVGQQYADRLSVQVSDALEVNDNISRHRLLKERM